MKIRIQYRLFFALLAASGLAVFGMFFIMQWSIDRGFLQYVNTLEQTRLERLAAGLEEAYAGSGSWTFLKDDPAEWLRQMLRTRPEGSLSPEQMQRLERRLDRRAEQGRLPPPEGRLPGPAHRFESRVLLLDAEGRRILGPRGESDLTRTPLRHDGTVVGYLALLPQKELSDVHQLRFVQQQKLALALVGLVVLLISTLFSLPLARRLVRPIQLLAAATRRLAGGAYSTRVAAASGDELGQLARDFNALALTLEKNETARRQWVADISHELRTPLSVLRGEIEALQDGIRQPTPKAIASLHTEAMRLGRLVDDLYQLAVSDLGALSYRKEKTDLTTLLREALASMRQRFADKGLTLKEELPASDLRLFADPERLHQLMANLLENTLKYTDAPGEARVSLRAEKSTAVLRIDDSPPGVPEEAWTRLFESLYRVEGSRSRTTGGAGLGLAICRNIVQAHDGSITAGPSPLGGVRITISFPLEKMP